MVAIFKTDLKYLRPPPASLGVMTKDKTKMRLKPFVNCSKTKKISQQIFVLSYDKSLRFKTKIKIRPFVNTPGSYWGRSLALSIVRVEPTLR